MNKMVAFSKFPSLFAHLLLSKTAHCSTSHLSKQSICTFLLASSLTFSPFHTANLLPTLPSLQLHLVRSCVNTRKTIRSQEAVKLHQERYMLQHERRQGVVKLHQQKYIFDQGICFMEAVVISCTLANVNYLEHLLVICSPSQANKNLDSFCRFVGSPSGESRFCWS